MKMINFLLRFLSYIGLFCTLNIVYSQSDTTLFFKSDKIYLSGSFQDNKMLGTWNGYD